jgi:TonB-dependent receptor
MTTLIRTGVSLAALAAAAVANAQATTAAADEGEIVVTGQRRSLERAIEVKRDALGIVDAAAANDIGRLPDRNVAEVVERLPGVGVLYDQGEGRFVSVRGVPSALNNYTIDGFEIGNPDGLTRALPLDVISGQLLNRVEVTKAKTADLDAQGIGGTINLVTQTAFDFADSFALQASGQVGYQESNEDEVPVRGDVSIARRFGADETVGIVLGVSYSDRTFRSDGLFPDDWRPVPQALRGGLPINTKFTDYELNRERVGATGSLDFRPSDAHRFYIRGLYSRFTEDEYRQRYRLDFAPGNAQALIASGALVINPDGLTGTSTATERRQDLRLEYKEKSVLSFTAGGASAFGPWSIDYALNRVHNEVIEPNRLWQFRGNPGIVDFDFTDKLYTAVPRTELTPAGLQFRQYSEQDERGEEDIWQGRADVRRDIAFGEASWVKAGVKYRSADKQFDAENTTYTRGANNATRFTLGQFDLAGAPATVRPEPDRPYRNAPTIDPAKIAAFTDARLPGPFFVLSAAATAQAGALSDFDLTEEVGALYAMANLDFGDVELTPGLRVERTDFDIDGFAVQGGSTVVPVASRNRYTDFVPSLLLRATPSDDVVIRFAYSRSIGRPEYNDLVPGGSVDAQNETASLGNPDLKPYVADALDAAVEYYFARGGLVSVGLFGKQIKNPIFRQEELVQNVAFAGQTFPRLRISRPLNADEGEILGLELGYQQQFTFLPGWLSGFGVAANLTLADSKLDVPGRAEESTFQGQADTLWGVQLLYQKGAVEASVAYHDTGRFLALLGSEPFADQYSDAYRRLDAKASVALSDHARLFVEGQNLTDEPTRFSQGDMRDWIIQHERYGRTFYVGATLSF